MANHQTALGAIGIAGSPSANSRSRVLVARVLAELSALGVEGRLIDLVELPADALLARRQDETVAEAIQRTTRAQIVVLGTPVYRASYAGQLKAFLDLFPQDALRDRVVGLVATGAGPIHALAIDHGLRPLVASLRGLTAARAIYAVDAQFPDKNNLPQELAQQARALAEELYALASGLAGVDRPEA